MPNEDTLIFSARLKEALVKRNIKQVDLARTTGISSANINRYIKGLYMPKMRFIKLIATALQVSPDWLIGASEDMDLVDPEKDELHKKIVLLINSMSKEQMTKLVKFIEDYIL